MYKKIKRIRKVSQKRVKGMPSAVILSILIHTALFLLAGMLVVFTVVKKEEQKFEPPKAVERPKMKLRKGNEEGRRSRKWSSCSAMLKATDRGFLRLRMGRTKAPPHQAALKA